MAPRDMLRRRTSLVANGAKRICKWLPRAIVAARMTPMRLRVRRSRGSEEWRNNRPENRRPSLGPDVGRPDHLAPFLGFLGDELAEIGRRPRERRAAQVGKPRLHLGVGKSSVDFLVELVDDFGRGVLGRADTVKRARLVTRQKIAHGRNVRQCLQRVAVVTANARSLPALMYSMEQASMANTTCTCPPANR